MSRGENATARHSIVMDNELWAGLQDVAKARDVSVSWLIRQWASDEVSSARESGEIPRRRRKR